MRSSIVPAQITTVEDKVAGALSFSQLGLLGAPVFLAGVMYALLPPFFAASPYKLAGFFAAAVICGVLAIRVRGQLVLTQAVRFGRYSLRPRFVLYDKNDLYLRPEPVPDARPEVTQWLSEADEEHAAAQRQAVVFYERPTRGRTDHISQGGRRVRTTQK